MSRLIKPTILAPALDLTKRQFEATHKGILVIGTWFRAEGQNGWEPCMVLLHAFRPIRSGRTIPVVIKLRDAWRWAMHGDVGDPAHCVASIIEWLHYGYLPGNPASKADHLIVMEAINSRLPDLITMPPRPVGDKVTVADMVIKNRETGEIIEEREAARDA